MSFSGWSLFGSLANVAKTQVITIFLNIFYGVFVNAAVGVANQVSTALNSFVSNFQIAFNPQIVKLYATHQKENLLKLIFQTTKFSYYLLLFLSLPVLMNTELILKIWLKVVPNYAAIFCQLTIIYLLIETISAPLWMAVQATGKIKKYQIIVSSILLLNVPISFFLLKLGFYPYSVSIVNICISLIALWVRLFFLHFLIDLPVMLFFKEILLRIVFVTLLSIIVPFGIRFYICDSLQLLLTTISSLMSVGLMILWLGLNEPERRFIYSKVLKLYNRNKRSL
jgi:O-antigen/teichoic acid export membrane protein